MSVNNFFLQLKKPSPCVFFVSLLHILGIVNSCCWASGTVPRVHSSLLLLYTWTHATGRFVASVGVVDVERCCQLVVCTMAVYTWVKGETSWQKKSVSLSPLLKVKLFAIVDVIYFLFRLLLMLSLFLIINSFVDFSNCFCEWLPLISDANFALISPIFSARSSPVCSSSFVFTSWYAKGIPLFRLDLITVYLLCPLPVFMPVAITFQPANQLRRETSKLFVASDPQR